MARGTHTVTRAIAKAGHPQVELVRGDGYHYLIFDNKLDGDALVYASHSIMCSRFNDRTQDQWVAAGVEFAKRVEAGTFDATGTHDL